MQRLDAREMLQEWLPHRLGDDGDPVFAALTPPDSQLTRDAPVFPSPGNTLEPCSRYLLDAWLRRPSAKAEMQKRPVGLWHPLRRKWGTERKGYPAKDVAAAGGWRHEPVMLASYQQADAETVRRVVLEPTQRLMAQ